MWGRALTFGNEIVVGRWSVVFIVLARPPSGKPGKSQEH